MVIAINTVVTQKNKIDVDADFMQELFVEIANQNPQHLFVFITDNIFNFLPKNSSQIIVKSIAQNVLASKYFYNLQLPFLFKKHNPNLLLQATGYCSLTSSIPQLLVLQNLQKKNKKYISKATHILASSQFLKNELIEKTKVDANKIDVVYGAAKGFFQPLDFEKNVNTKDGFADGREYFLLVGNKHKSIDFIVILKAFSLFKKWQKSNMKLLVAGSFDLQKNDVFEKMNTYKYKEDVVFLGSIEDVVSAKIMASAYCVLYPNSTSNFNTQLIAAMQCGVPVIANDTGNLKELGGDATIYTNTTLAEAIAEQMQCIYKDENLRSDLIKKSLLQSRKFSLEITAKQVWDSIKKITGNSV